MLTITGVKEQDPVVRDDMPRLVARLRTLCDDHEKHKNHGFTAYGTHVWEAWERADKIEAVCRQMELLCR